MPGVEEITVQIPEGDWGLDGNICRVLEIKGARIFGSHVSAVSQSHNLNGAGWR